MGLEAEVKSRISMLKHYKGKVESIETLLEELYDEKYTGILGGISTFKEEIDRMYNTIKVNQTRKTKNVYVDSGGTSKVLDLRGYPEKRQTDESMEHYLTDTLASVEEALYILKNTQDSDKKKLDYITSAGTVNKYLLQVGYLDGVDGYMQQKLTQYAEDVPRKYFKLRAGRSPFSDGGLRVSVTLDAEVIPDIMLYTDIRVEDLEQVYPNYTGVVTQYSSTYINEDALTRDLGEIEETVNENLSRFRETRNKLAEYNSPKMTRLEKRLNKKRVSDLERKRDSSLDEVLSVYTRLVYLKIDIEMYLHAMQVFGDNLKEIEEEQHSIMKDLAEWLNTDLQYKEMTLHN